MLGITRRELISRVGGAAAASAQPCAARAQEQMRRVALVGGAGSDSDPETQARVAAFRDGLAKLGWVEGRNVRIDVRFSASDPERIRSYAAELTDLSPDVIVSSGTPSLAALVNLTRSLPIVFVAVSDPVSAGFVPGLAKPGSNITGFSNYEYSIAGKWLQLLKEVAPATARVGVLLWRGDSSWSRYLAPVETLAPSLGVQLTRIFLGDAKEIERDIDTFGLEPHGGLLVISSSRALVFRNLIADLAIRNRLPTVVPARSYAISGGLMSYGVDIVDQFRRAASYVDRILRGEKPGDLPVQLPTKYEFVINIRTARAMGFMLPPSLPLRADEVIE
jgi:putative ABC transport system substrate-binding protein